MGKIAVALVGLGRIAGLLEEDPLREKPCTHIGAVRANPDCSLVAGADHDETRRNLFENRWQCPVYEDAEKMIKTHNPHILVIATNPDSHARYCVMAEALKVPVVICEKPLADTVLQAERIAALHRKGTIRILTNHERRYAADYIRAKAILDEGRLGGILSAKATLYMGTNRRLLDVLWHDGTHLADALMFLSNAGMKHEKTWGAKLKTREGTAFLMGHLVALPDQGKQKNPIPFLLELGAKRDHLVFEVEFSCEQGRLRIGNGIFEVWESGPSPYAQGFKSLKRTPEVFDGPTGYFVNMVQDAVACVGNPVRQPRSSAADGLRVIEYLNSVQPWRKETARSFQFPLVRYYR
ncbi:MAG: Gfo/Idh/MocA family oxidoreductase [Treponema sp.]|jgi:predicted dehydrogenase|nr:Gfo/Idh/MocA family oxidoreductase [Treponema sp.]